jgi:uncharacterized membrane protein
MKNWLVVVNILLGLSILMSIVNLIRMASIGNGYYVSNGASILGLILGAMLLPTIFYVIRIQILKKIKEEGEEQN